MKSERIYLRVSKEEKEKLEKLAEKESRSLSGLVRFATQKYLEEKGGSEMLKLYYVDEEVKILLGEVATNHSMSVEDIIDLLDIDLEDKFINEMGWDDFDYNCLTLVSEN